MSGLGGLIFGIPWIAAVLALFVIFRRERVRRERGLAPSTPRPLFLLYQLVAFVIVALVAYSVVMSVRGPA